MAEIQGQLRQAIQERDNQIQPSCMRMLSYKMKSGEDISRLKDVEPP